VRFIKRFIPLAISGSMILVAIPRLTIAEGYWLGAWGFVLLCALDMFVRTCIRHHMEDND
jgi:hypothetical protein